MKSSVDLVIKIFILALAIGKGGPKNTFCLIWETNRRVDFHTLANTSENTQIAVDDLTIATGEAALDVAALPGIKPYYIFPWASSNHTAVAV